MKIKRTKKQDSQKQIVQGILFEEYKTKHSNFFILWGGDDHKYDFLGLKCVNRHLKSS